MEQLLVLLVLILIPLANFLLDRMRRRYQPPPQPDRQPVDMGVRRQPVPASTIPTGRAQVPERAPRMALERPGRKKSAAKFFRSKREIRRAIVAMVILGPCRANESRG